MPGPGLGREIRVGDLPPDHADQVTLPVGQRLVGLLRAGDPARAQHRDVHRGADRGRDVQSVPGAARMLATTAYRLAVATPVVVLM